MKIYMFDSKKVKSFDEKFEYPVSKFWKEIIQQNFFLSKTSTLENVGNAVSRQ